MGYSALLLGLRFAVQRADPHCCAHEAGEIAAFDEAALRVATEVVQSRLADLVMRTGRRAARLEACRLGAEQNLRALNQSLEWRPHIALNATAMSMPLGATRN